jgi:methylglutaconyl-CoA hydratase
MDFETLRLTVDSRGVATLTLNRPDRRNAISAAMMDELTRAAHALSADPGVRAVVLTGAGAAFCAGGDLGWMQQNFEADRATRIAEGMRLARALQALNTLPKPLVGRVHGMAYGGGVGLMSVCDSVVIAEDASLGLTEVRLGLIPATIAPYVVARIGEGHARRLFVTARRFGAAEALAMGLAHVAAAPEALDAAVEGEVAAILDGAPGAIARSKALARALGPVIDDHVIADTVRRLADAWESPDPAEGVAAFFARREPAWRRGSA